MNEVLLNNINEVVMPEDTLFCGGDFVFGKNKQENVIEFRNLIKCKNIICLIGNHDNADAIRQKDVFQGVYNRWEGHLHNQYIVFDHYPILSWNHMNHGAWMLHGHCHGDLWKNLLGRDIDTELGRKIMDRKILDVGVDNPLLNYKPISFWQIKEYMKNKAAHDRH